MKPETIHSKKMIRKILEDNPHATHIFPIEGPKEFHDDFCPDYTHWVLFQLNDKEFVASYIWNSITHEWVLGAN